jgi:hypothetical protein
MIASGASCERAHWRAGGRRTTPTCAMVASRFGNRTESGRGNSFAGDCAPKWSAGTVSPYLDSISKYISKYTSRDDTTRALGPASVSIIFVRRWGQDRPPRQMLPTVRDRMAAGPRATRQRSGGRASGKRATPCLHWRARDLLESQRFGAPSGHRCRNLAAVQRNRSLTRARGHICVNHKICYIGQIFWLTGGRIRHSLVVGLKRGTTSGRRPDQGGAGRQEPGTVT